MIESLLDAWRRFSGDENRKPDSQESSFQKNSEESFLAALPVVRKIVRRRTMPFQAPAAGDASDLEQGIILRLLDWREKNYEKSEKMSPEEWKSFAARAAYNEINRLFTEGTEVETVPLEEIHEAAGQKSVEGYTNAEVYSLVQRVWQEICSLSLRQRRALLFQSQELIVHFLQSEIGNGEIARVLEITESEWLDIKDRLPLSDSQIAELTRVESSGDKNIEPLTKSIKKARHEARARLKKLISE
jgi:hypothetical protein